MNTKKVLIVDYDPTFSDRLHQYLTHEGFDSTTVNSGQEALISLQRALYNVCILDINLPILDGLETLKQIHGNHPELPVIMMSENPESIDRILGLELGADDFISKAIDQREIKARIRAILRRTESIMASGFVKTLDKDKIYWDRQKRIFYINTNPIDLTGIEYEILVVLAENPGSVVSKESISLQAMHKKLPPFNRSLDVHISNIRKKIAEHNIEIKSVRGRGYQLSL